MDATKMVDRNNFLISNDIAKNFPELRIGLVIARGLVNSHNEELEKLGKDAENKIRTELNIESLSDHSHILAWRMAYKNFGANPKKYIPTCEAIVRRVLDGEKIPAINTLVNCYLITELEYLLPCGGYDIDKVEGPINLRYSTGNEGFFPIGGKATEFTKPGEIIYCDNKSILTRRWNYKDSDYSKITTETKNIILMSEAPYKDIKTEVLKKFVIRLSNLIKDFCGGIVEYDIISL